MPPADIVGKTGHAVTEVGTAGRVEVEGVAYDAFTVRHPIPAGEAVVVTGWRTVGDDGCVLSVRRPGDDGPAEVTPPAAPALTAPPLPPPDAADSDADRVRRLEEAVHDLRGQVAWTRTWLSGTLGALCGAALSLVVPIVTESTAVGGGEKAAARPLILPFIVASGEGPAGVRHDVRAAARLYTLVGCGVIGFGIGLAIGLVGAPPRRPGA